MAVCRVDHCSLTLADFFRAYTEPALLVAGGKVTGASPAAADIFGGELFGQEFACLIADPAATECLYRAANGAEQTVELSPLGKSPRRWLMRASRVSREALLVRFVDYSEARAAEQMRVDFVANASHELRTPLSTLIGYTETLRERAGEIDPETQERFLSIVHDEARRMQRIVEDLISLSRIEAERFTAPTGEVALEDMIDQAVDGVRRDAEERGFTIKVEIVAGISPLAGDRGEILQLLDNLISNALRYGDPESPVRVMARQVGRMVHLMIADRGEGIAAEHLPRITERFYRVDTSRSRALGGTGLGLAIVKHIVERHRGRLTIESKLGEGTTVHVYLPACGPAAVTKLS